MGLLNAQEDDSVVYGTLFYLPTCGHCHEVMDNVLPPLQAEYGDQLQIVYIDASVGNNSAIMGDTCLAVGVPYDRCGSVPLLIVGNEWMLGSRDIPNRLPGLIEDGLANGGTPFPAVESLRDYAGEHLTLTTTTAAPTDNRSITEKLAEDPVGNAVALVVLGLLIGSFGIVMVSGLKNDVLLQKWQSYGVAVGLVFAFIMSVSIILGEADDMTPIVLAITAGLLLLGGGWLYRTDDMKQFAIPVVASAGLVVAFYLAVVETTDTVAVCGVIGDCGAVQSSTYATLFGVLPVGVLGLVGFAAIIGAWGLRFVVQNKTWVDAALIGMVLFGTAFSIYLTFLEPFVIGATCAWCITSALIMIALLWMIAPQYMGALRTVLNASTTSFGRA